MRSSIAVMLVVVGVLYACGGTMAAGATEAPFHRGVNLSDWLEYVGSVRQIQFTGYTKQELVNIKSLGFDVIPLPIDVYVMTSGAPAYTIDPLFFHFLDQIVDWCEELRIHLILADFSDSGSVNTDPDIDRVLVPTWSQMAEHYKDRSRYLYYEVLNEPHGIADARWGQIQQAVINAIRAVDKVHTIIVTGAGYGSYNNLKFLPVYSDDNLIYTFHFFDPFMFTHQGASWTSPSMAPLGGVPFPYGAGPMPACPAQLKGTWIESSLKSYVNDGTVQHVKELIDIAVRFRDERQVPVYCGSFGACMLNSNPDQRAYWYEVVRSYLEEKGITWAIWCYRGNMGLFRTEMSELFEHDLNIPLVEALGLTPPAQTPFVPTADSTGFDLYTDYMATNVRNASHVGHGTLDFYCSVGPGDYCIYCTGFDLYNSVGFDFQPDKDLTALVQKGYVLDLWVAGDTPGARVEVRFIDTKTSAPGDHPWRKGAALDSTIVAWDGQWHHVQIPLKSFVERGSWDNAWFPPQGLFDWSAVDRFEIVAEYHSWAGMHFWFDDIRIAKAPGSR